MSRLLRQVAVRACNHLAAPALLLTSTFAIACCQPGYAETGGPFAEPVLPAIPIAAALPPPNLLPTDITPQVFNGQNQVLNRDVQFQLLKHLPARFYFSAINEVSNRLETNVFQTLHNQRQDYVFREAPTVTAGWMLDNHSSIYCNYFVIKDVFADHYTLTPPTFQSLSLGLKRDIVLGDRTTATIDWQARQLWQARNLYQADMLPSFSMSRTVTNNFTLFGSTLLQLRGKDYFVPATREIDPFYSVGLIYRRGLWNFSANTTYITNFRNHNAIPPKGNVNMISDYEISRPIIAKFPYVVSFIRAEPIWNWHGHRLPGQSGFDFRLYGGIRMAFSKEPFNASVNEMRQQLIEQEQVKQQQKQQPPTSTPTQSTPPSQQ